MLGGRPLTGRLLPGRGHARLASGPAAAHHGAAHRLPLPVRLGREREPLHRPYRGEHADQCVGHLGHHWGLDGHHRAPEERQPPRFPEGYDGFPRGRRAPKRPVPRDSHDDRHESVVDHLQQRRQSHGGLAEPFGHERNANLRVRAVSGERPDRGRRDRARLRPGPQLSVRLLRGGLVHPLPPATRHQYGGSWSDRGNGDDQLWRRRGPGEGRGRDRM